MRILYYIFFIVNSRTLWQLQHLLATSSNPFKMSKLLLVYFLLFQCLQLIWLMETSISSSNLLSPLWHLVQLWNNHYGGTPLEHSYRRQITDCSWLMVCGLLVRREYVLTKHMKAILESKKIELVCASPICRKPLELNDKVVSRRGYRSRRSTLYHAECYDKLFY